MDMPAISPLQPATTATATPTDTGADAASAPFGEVLAAELEDGAEPSEAIAAPATPGEPAETADAAASAGEPVAGEVMAAMTPASSPLLTAATLQVTETVAPASGDGKSMPLSRAGGLSSAAPAAFTAAQDNGRAEAGNSENQALPEAAQSTLALPVESVADALERSQTSSPSTSPATAAAPAAPAAGSLGPVWTALPTANHGSAAAPVLEVALPVQHPNWAAQFSERVSLSVSEGLQSAELRVNPEELGPVRIRVSLDRNEASVVFAAVHPLVREAIEQALPTLRESLLNAGLQLGEAFVAGGQLQGGQAREHNVFGQPGGGKAEEATPVAALGGRVVSPTALVDIYA